MKPWQIAALLIGLCLAVVGLTAYTWWHMGDVEMSWLGILAMVGGVLGALALGMGLMALVFYSSRSGHDDAAGRESRANRRFVEGGRDASLTGDTRDDGPASDREG